jgi:Uma2 family endonuclease
MATSVLIPVSEYLRTSYSPDCDYVDGEVQERNLGESDHSDLQGQLLDLLRTPANKVYVRANPEIRVQVGPTRFRVPDVCIRRVPALREQIIRQPPLLCIEILSPEDRVSRTREKIRDYLDMGVIEVWVVDPAARSVMICAGATMVEQTAGVLKVPETPITLSLEDIFKALDDY